MWTVTRSVSTSAAFAAMVDLAAQQRWMIATRLYPLEADAPVPRVGSRVAAFTENHARSGARSSLSDYYAAAYGRVVFDKGLREHMVFSDHSLATDSVFAEVHLVSCRNVLIYFERDLQNRALGLFRESLCHRGFLGLGSKESLRFSAHTDAFDDFVPQDRIYRKKAGL